VDLGEKCLAAAYDGEEALVFDGERLRQLRAVQNREKRRFARKIDRKEKGSRRWTTLVQAKKRRLKKLRDRTEDVLHKMSTRLVEELWARGVSTIVVGDLTGIRESIDYDTDTNRRLHGWAFRRLTEMIEYKAERYGISVESTREAYTSQTCPRCGAAKASHKDGRTFCCSECDLTAHRDVVGAMNIREKAQDPDGWQSGYLKAERASASGEKRSPRGSPSGRKPQLSLFSGESGAAASTRATLREEPLEGAVPEAIQYAPHMRCVLGADPAGG